MTNSDKVDDVWGYVSVLDTEIENQIDPLKRLVSLHIELRKSCPCVRRALLGIAYMYNIQRPRCDAANMRCYVFNPSSTPTLRSMFQYSSIDERGRGKKCVKAGKEVREK